MWMPILLVNETACLFSKKIKQCIPLAEKTAHMKLPFASNYIALMNCDCASGMDSSIKLMNNSGVSFKSSPSTVYTSDAASEYQSLIGYGLRLIGFSISYSSAVSYGIPFNVAFWVCFMCSSITVALAGQLCSIVDGMLCFSFVNSFRS